MDEEMKRMLQDLGDQGQYTAHKVEALSSQIHNLVLTTTIAEVGAAITLIVAAFAIRIAYKTLASRLHSYPMPKELVLPRLEPPLEAKDFHIPDKGRIDTLAELAKALNAEGFRT